MSKKELQNDSIRKNYYQMSDGVYGLDSTIHNQIPQDDEAKKLIKEIKAKVNELRDHLDKNYLWD